jgi:pimeloyl-ACP methyl ester carboxylesterase
MPVATVRGVHINYEVLGERGPWVALQPGGRRNLAGVKSLGEKLAEAGSRVLVYDGAIAAPRASRSRAEIRRTRSGRRICALCCHSSMRFQRISGAARRCRLALLIALRHPADVRGLLLWRVTGGAYAAQRLVENYYTNFINAAQQGGMEAVCRTEHFAEVIASNPANRARLTALDPQRFIGIMEEWRRAFNEGAQHPVIGLSPSELRSLTMPACIIPGNDRVHPRGPGQAAHRLMPNSEYHEVLTEDRPDLDVALEEWSAKEGLLAAIFIDFLRRAERRS